LFGNTIYCLILVRILFKWNIITLHFCSYSDFDLQWITSSLLVTEQQWSCLPYIKPVNHFFIKEFLVWVVKRISFNFCIIQDLFWILESLKICYVMLGRKNFRIPPKICNVLLIFLIFLLQPNFGIHNKIFSQNDSQFIRGTCEIVNATKIIVVCLMAFNLYCWWIWTISLWWKSQVAKNSRYEEISIVSALLY